MMEILTISITNNNKINPERFPYPCYVLVSCEYWVCGSRIEAVLKIGVNILPKAIKVLAAQANSELDELVFESNWTNCAEPKEYVEIAFTVHGLFTYILSNHKELILFLFLIHSLLRIYYNIILANYYFSGAYSPTLNHFTGFFLV